MFLHDFLLVFWGLGPFEFPALASWQVGYRSDMQALCNVLMYYNVFMYYNVLHIHKLYTIYIKVHRCITYKSIFELYTWTPSFCLEDWWPHDELVNCRAFLSAAPATALRRWTGRLLGRRRCTISQEFCSGMCVWMNKKNRSTVFLLSLGSDHVIFRVPNLNPHLVHIESVWASKYSDLDEACMWFQYISMIFKVDSVDDANLISEVQRWDGCARGSSEGCRVHLNDAKYQRHSAFDNFGTSGSDQAPHVRNYKQDQTWEWTWNVMLWAANTGQSAIDDWTP